MTEPIRCVGLQWWILLGVGLAWVAVKTHKLELLERSVKVREVFSTLLFFIAVSMSFSLITAMSTPNWEPDVRKRLVVVMKDVAKNQTVLLLAESIKSRTDSDPSFVRHNPPAPAALLHAKEGADVKPDPAKELLRRLLHSYPHEAEAEAAEHAEAEAAEHEAMLSAAREVGRERVRGIDVAAPAAADLKPGVTEAAPMYRSLTMESKNVRERASAAREAVAFSMISALDDVIPTGSVPVLRDFLSEVISGAAGEISRNLMEKLPLERALVIGGQFTDRVSDSIMSKTDLFVRAVVNCSGPNKSPLASMEAPALKDWIDREKAEIEARNYEAKALNGDARDRVVLDEPLMLHLYDDRVKRRKRAPRQTSSPTWCSSGRSIVRPLRTI